MLSRVERGPRPKNGMADVRHPVMLTNDVYVYNLLQCAGGNALPVRSHIRGTTAHSFREPTVDTFTLFVT